MKKTRILHALMLSSTVFFTGCDRKGHMEKSVEVDGSKMTITVNGTFDNKHIDFKKEYDINNLNKEEMQMLTEHVFDSLGVGK